MTTEHVQSWTQPEDRTRQETHAPRIPGTRAQPETRAQPRPEAEAAEDGEPQLGKRARTEEKILSIAGTLFLAHGFRATTVRGIAKAAEVSVGRVMAVGDKDVLLIRCYDRWIEQLQSGSPSAVARGPQSPPTTSTAEASANGAPTSAVQSHLLGIFLPFFEFFAANEDLSRDYAAALIRVRGKPAVFDRLAQDLQGTVTENLVSIGRRRELALQSATALYTAYLGILFQWAASDMSSNEATAALSQAISFHTALRRPQ